MRLQESHGSSTPQSPWPSPKKIDEAVKECISGNCGKVREMIRIARLREFETNADISPLTLIIGSYVTNALSNYFSISKIYRMAMINWNALRRLLRLGDVFEFSRISDFRVRSFFDAYWQFTSLATLRLPFIVKSRFDPPNDICGAFEDEELCHEFIAGYLIAESWKSTRPSRRFKLVGTTHPATVALLLSIADHFAKHGVVTKVRIDEKMNEVYFEFDGLPNDVRRFVEDVWENPTILTKLANEEFMTLLAGLMAGDGSITWSGYEVVVFGGNLEREKPLYVVIQGELGRRFGVKTFLSERKNLNAVELYAKYYDAIKLLRLLPPLIEPLKELRRQVLLNKDKLGTLTSRLFEMLGRSGIHGLQSHQAIRFLTTLTHLGLIRLRKVESFKYYILETPTNPHGRALK